MISRFIENFNKDFKASIPPDTLSFLEDLYENYVSISSTNDTETEYISELEKLVEQLNNSLNADQLEIFNKYDDVKDSLLVNNNKHAFVYGFCVCELLHKIDTTRF